ncbi:hypothetical protein G6011_02190 [Alternaria panax]|uniref:Uncharacterized protein n=1 Tax=Alternaria panax TaxID=48097 RepID=A0AAD4FEC1_9PLEO|nr:hypothetical protein G6011_02190 [Alternaria panax]
MAPRRPSTANDLDSRMPFASAEALLWGPEMKLQHAHLLAKMRMLHEQHEAYDARIRTTEHAAEAAEAATSRVRHLEQQLAAIEAEDDDKAFEKWAVGEMTRLGIFVDTNKHVRQKQIELDNAVSHTMEDLDKLRQVPRDLQGVFRRLDLLETGRNQDTRRIRSLEKEVTHLKAMRHNLTTNTAGPQTVPRSQQGIMRSMTPSQLLNAEISDATTEIDDEDLLPMQKIMHEEIQVPQSPEREEKNPKTTSTSSVVIGSLTKSARRRLMHRPSIHDSMLLQKPEGQIQFRTPIALPTNVGDSFLPATQLLPQRQSRAPALISVREAPSHPRASPPPTQLLHHDRTSPAPALAVAPTRKAPPRARVAPPSTQLVNKASPKKRKLPEKEPQTQRLTRAQAKRSQVQEAEEQKPPGAGSPTLLPSTQLVEPASSSRKKQKTAHVQESDQVVAKSSTTNQVTYRAPANSERSAATGPDRKKATEPTQLVTRSSVKSNIPKITASPIKKRNRPNRPDAASPQKQKSLIVILRSPQKAAGTERSESGDMQTTAADRVKMSPRKAAAAPQPHLNTISRPPSARKAYSRAKPAIGTSGSSKKPNASGMKPEISK